MLPDGTLPDDYVVLDLETTGVSCIGTPSSSSER